jgi:hypothetical protein
LLPDNKVIEQMPQLNEIEAGEIMKNNFELMRKIAKDVVYYIQNLHNELHNYNRSKLNLKSTRHLANFQGVIDGLDAYSNTQEEFDDWLLWVNDCITNYNNMVNKTNVMEQQETNLATVE